MCHVLVYWTETLIVRELGVESFSIEHEDRAHVDEVDQSEREETEADSLLEALLEEDGHVDAVGGETDEEEDGDDDGGLDSVKELLRLKTDEVVGVVLRVGCVYANNNAVLWNAVH